MTDNLKPDKRSWLMGRVKGKDTKPEMVVRKQLFHNGFRYRLHRKELPGSPDIVLTKYRTVIFVHGCFWHRHQKCKKATTPKTRQAFWSIKFDQNIARDADNEKKLVELGWKVLTIWECETKHPVQLMTKLTDYLR